MNLSRTIALIAIVALVGACTAEATDPPAAPAAAAPQATPVVVYVTPPPTPTPTAEPTPEPTPVPTPVVTPVPKPQVVTLSGKCHSCKTKKFALEEGDWKIVVSGTAAHDWIGGYDFGGGNVIFELYQADGSELLVNEIVDGGKSYKYTTAVYDLAGGPGFYVDVQAPAGKWKITLTHVDGPAGEGSVG